MSSSFVLHPVARAALCAVAASAALAVPAAHAQSSSMSATAATTAATTATTTTATPSQTIVITGNPLGTSAVQPSTVLSGEGLALRRAGTLGDTLDGLPGVSATGYGPNSSRPVIRGLDGDRIRLLDNGGASIDASNLSFDHASATDPLVTERIEVLRGPAALLYGGSATGGVINSIDNRIPRSPASGLSGRAEVRLGGAASERAGAAVLEGGSDASKTGGGGFVWHADAFGRKADDLRVPRFTPVDDGVALDPANRVRNSAAQSHGGAVGAGWASSQGYLGAAVETSRNDYGVTVEPDVTIHMKRDRVSLGGEWREPVGPFVRLSTQASHTRYQHQEIEGTGEVGTTFKSSGSDLRIEAQHAPIGGPNGVHGVVGLQAETMDFEALGEEAFVPATKTRSAALFALEEIKAGPVIISAGGRVERVKVDSSGDADLVVGRFGSAQQRSFTPGSASLGARWGGPQGFQLNATLGHTERAPAYYELYANGLHVATGGYERGDTALPAESSRHAELGAGFTQGAHHVKLSVFDTRFSRFISLDATGQDIVVPGEPGEPPQSVPAYAFRAVRAHLRGAELEARTRLMAAPFALELSGNLDSVRGTNLDSGEPLPRLAPLRARLGLDAVMATWRTGVGVRYAARQDRVPSTDTPTAGYTMLDLWADGRLPLGESIGLQTRWFARLNNATDRLATSASTLQTMRGLSPLPGRALTVGLRTVF